jgi:hypothetical protein
MVVVMQPVAKSKATRIPWLVTRFSNIRTQWHPLEPSRGSGGQEAEGLPFYVCVSSKYPTVDIQPKENRLA